MGSERGVRTAFGPVVAATAFLVYAAAYMPVYASSGIAAAALAVVPAGIGGWTFGKFGGAVAGVVAALLTRSLRSFAGDEPGGVESFLIGTAMLVLCGVVIGASRDIARRLRSELALHEQLLRERHVVLEKAVAAEERLRSLLAGNPAVVYSTDLAGVPTFISENVRDVLGLDGEAIVRAKDDLRSRVHPEDRQLVEAHQEELLANGSIHREFRAQHGDGKWMWIRDEVRVVRDAQGQPHELIGYFTDITDRKLAQEEAAREAMMDPTTGMPNRVALDLALRALLAGPETCCDLVLVDIDGFDEIFEAFGSQAGDLVLRAIANRLRGAAGPDDIVAHVGKDKFAALFTRCDSAPSEYAALLLEAFTTPFLVDGHELTVTAAAGVAHAPDHDRTPEGLFRAAEMAMYDAKRAREPFQVYSADRDRLVRSQLELASDLRHAIERGELVLHFQPVIDTRTRTVTHAEALLRWRHPTRGLVPPAEFIPIAEQAGLMKSITAWVIDESVRRCWAWHEQGVAIGVAANLSVRNLTDAELPAQIRASLDRWGVPASQLTLEITESVVMADPERALETLTRLRAMGVRLAVDDFGTGYSSLAYLNRLPVDTIKVDRSFVKNLTADESAAAIVRATVELAHTLGFGVVAEGVEDASAVELLALYGCDALQGYHIARPLPEPDLLGWMARSASEVRRVITPDLHRSSPSVLVVDDQDVVRITANLLLSRHGFTVLQASGGSEAIELLRDDSRRIDAVLTDVVMPDVDGKDLASALAVLRPHVPAVFMSGHPLSSLDLPAGAPFVTKPFTEQSLVETISGVLSTPNGRRSDLN